MKKIQTVLGLFLLLTEKGFAAVTRNPLITNVTIDDLCPSPQRIWYASDIDKELNYETRNGSTLQSRIVEGYIVDVNTLLESYEEEIEQFLNIFKSDLAAASQVVKDIKEKEDSLKPLIDKIASDAYSIDTVQPQFDAAANRVIQLKHNFEQAIEICDIYCHNGPVSRSGSGDGFIKYYCGTNEDVKKEIKEYSDAFVTNLLNKLEIQVTTNDAYFRSRIDLFKEEAQKKAYAKLGKTTSAVIHLSSRYSRLENYLKGLHPDTQIYNIKKQLFDLDKTTLSTDELVSELLEKCLLCPNKQLKMRGADPNKDAIHDQQLVKERFDILSNIIANKVSQDFGQLFSQLDEELKTSPQNIDQFLNKLNPVLDKLEKEINPVYTKLVAITKTVPYIQLRNIKRMSYQSSNMLRRVLNENDVTQDYLNTLPL